MIKLYSPSFILSVVVTTTLASVWPVLMVVVGMVSPGGRSIPAPLSWMALGIWARRAAVTVTLIGSPGLISVSLEATVTAKGVVSRTASTMLRVIRLMAG